MGLFTVLEDRVEGIQVLFLPSSGVVALHEEVVITLAITILVVQDALRFVLVTACSTHFLSITF
jgi:hypothetical protein